MTDAEYASAHSLLLLIASNARLIDWKAFSRRTEAAGDSAPPAGENLWSLPQPSHVHVLALAQSALAMKIVADDIVESRALSAKTDAGFLTACSECSHPGSVHLDGIGACGDVDIVTNGLVTCPCEAFKEHAQ